MPYDFAYRNRHSEIPGEVAGYELAPLSDKGLWSIVSPSGIVTNLNTLGLQVLAYTGAGMPPVENIATPLGVLGGSYLQRTVVRPRTIILSCIAQGLTFAQVQQVKNLIIAQVAPYNSLQTSKVLKLHYQLVNYCGDAIGTAMEVAVTYAGDLTGNTTNLYQDRFDLQFVEFAPPGIKELTTKQPSLGYYIDRSGLYPGYRYRSPVTGEWTYTVLTDQPSALAYDQAGELWYGNGSQISNRSGSAIIQLVNSNVLAITSDSNNYIFAGGSFTSPRNYIMVYYSGTWHAIPLTTGAAINGTVRAMVVGIDNNLYIGGDFPAPYTHIVRYTYNIGAGTGSWTNIGATSGGSSVWDMVNGLDGNIYIVGDFGSINSVVSFGIIKYNPVLGATGTFTTMTSTVGFTGGGGAMTLAALPDGRIALGGLFSTVNGISATNVAVYNGTNFQPLGNGLNARVAKLVVNNATGELYAYGAFSKSGNVNLPGGVAKWNGSSWVPLTITNFLSSGSINYNGMAIRQSDGELTLSSENTSLTNGVLNTLIYTGTADVYPQIKFTGPGTLWTITNCTTGKNIYFNNYTLLAGETATFTHDPAGGIIFTSSFYGNVLGRILPGSDTAAFSLVPGTNYIVPYMTGVTGATKVELIYQNTHFSFESGAPA